jgi:hypothetical protein
MKADTIILLALAALLLVAFVARAALDAASDLGSTVSGRARILVTVHSAPLRRWDGRLATTTFAERFRMDNLLKAHS